MEHFHTDDFARFIEIKDYAGRHLFRLDDFRVIQTEIQGVRLGIEMQLHSLFFMVRSKNTLTTRHGATLVFVATLSTLFPYSGNPEEESLDIRVIRILVSQFRIGESLRDP